MAFSDETRNQVRYAVVRSGMSLTQAAELAGISVATARQWKAKARRNGDDWDVARQAAVMAQGGLGDMATRILDDFALQFKRGMQALEDDDSLSAVDRADTLTRLADAYMKITKAAASVSTGHQRLASALETLELLANFIAEQYPQLAQSYLEIIEPFGEYLNKHYGSQ